MGVLEVLAHRWRLYHRESCGLIAPSVTSQQIPEHDLATKGSHDGAPVGPAASWRALDERIFLLRAQLREHGCELSEAAFNAVPKILVRCISSSQGLRQRRARRVVLQPIQSGRSGSRRQVRGLTVRLAPDGARLLGIRVRCPVAGPECRSPMSSWRGRRATQMGSVRGSRRRTLGTHCCRSPRCRPANEDSTRV